ncbi:TIGR03013 family XrtA/PEP-CTERM system glycosyltransferase [Hahella ganghwensis]|uniref:TIGR03013 family XrtA/PEP-CTERM system glycosyltransferase n=1 Tax=Hahella ganghwensis TaxID=286420 RepID=UPI000476DADB|nr:TIGR03013 family XrtA/PEP-CTERM system glycosyltransferase [Hahella ganghwensis]
MAHIRILKHYVHFPFLILGLLELCACMLAIYAAVPTRLLIGDINYTFQDSDLFYSALAYGAVILISMNAMGVYQARLSEGRTGMALRTLVAFVIGSLVFPIFYYISSDIFGVIWRSVLVLATLYAVLFVLVVRILFYTFVDENIFKRNVLILGTGKRANGLLEDFRKPEDWKGVHLVGFYPFEGDDVIVDDSKVIKTPLGIMDYVLANAIDEIVIAVDDRRKKLPLEELMACKLEGIEVVQESTFTERETRKVPLNVISPGWFIFSDGFKTSALGSVLKRSFDILASLILLSVTWPFILVTVACIKFEEGLKAPIFYKQVRVGVNGEPFEVIKFRSMGVDAEKGGQAIWASKNDDRVTKVGAVIRKYRIDELPQLFNVLKGEMAFVGPRPERPVFVEKLANSIPYYNERHRVKPGITGWAQLCFDYADSEEDSKEKLRYDLYYIKNNSLMLDFLILLQTVEVVLFKKGAH